VGHPEDSRRQPWFLQTAPSSGPYLYHPAAHGPPGYEFTDDYQDSPTTCPRAVRTNITAIAAFVCAILFAPGGIVLGHVARRQIARTGGAGEGLATAALFIGYVLIAIPVVIYLTVALVLMGSAVADTHHSHRYESTVATTP
jgi:hypothetical protein